MNKEIPSVPLWAKKPFYISLILTIIIFILLKSYVFVIYSIRGDSMNPTLHRGDYIVISKLAYEFHGIHRFDIVLFNSSKGPKTYVKRIIGLPGESISYINDNLYVNGKIINEGFIKDEKQNPHKFKPTSSLPEVDTHSMDQQQLTDYKQYQNEQNSPYYTANFNLKELVNKSHIPDGYVFVLGDNRPISNDSRYLDIGLVPIKNIIGKQIF
ncbi:signal peptidase I [Bacillus cereus]|uniref:signal peptidase I n=1 Tax=Bacillus cereus group TaxID=86661 RepID=UPI00301586CF